jgi:hypothetical protein
MFQLHDTTRRRLCLAGFLSLGLAPALLVGGWCFSRHLPGEVQAEAHALSRRLGFDVKLSGVKHLRPGTLLYENFEAADPETGETIFRCRLLEVAAGEASPAPQSRPMIVMTASQPEVEAAALERIWRCLQGTLEGSRGPLEADMQFAASELTLHASSASQTLTAIQGRLENLPGGTHAQLEFRLVGADTPEPARIRVGRDRQASPPTSRFELYTGDGELPCHLLAMGLAELRPLGPRCRFRGYIWASETPDGWQGEVTGQLAELDLGGLVSDHFSHRMSGMAEVVIQSARFRQGRLEEGSVILAAGPGTIDRSLMEAASARLGLVTGRGPLPEGDQIGYDQLAFSATLDMQGLRLCGRCSTAEPGTVLSEGRRSLLGQPERQPAPAVALVRTLVPDSVVQVPATRQTDWLLRRLPVPEVVPPAGSRTDLPHARLRLPETWQR